MCFGRFQVKQRPVFHGGAARSVPFAKTYDLALSPARAGGKMYAVFIFLDALVHKGESAQMNFDQSWSCYFSLALPSTL